MARLILGCEARGTDQWIGRLTAIVCETVPGTVTHLVCNADDVAGSERLVPVDHLATVDDAGVTIDLTRHEFFDLPTFETCVAVGTPIDAGSWMTFATHERIPASRAALRRLTRVVDGDGHRVGHVDGVTVDDADHRITSVLVRTGHLLHHEDVAVRAADVAHLDEAEITLSTAVPAPAGVASGR